MVVQLSCSMWPCTSEMQHMKLHMRLRLGWRSVSDTPRRVVYGAIRCWRGRLCDDASRRRRLPSAVPTDLRRARRRSSPAARLDCDERPAGQGKVTRRLRLPGQHGFGVCQPCNWIIVSTWFANLSTQQQQQRTVADCRCIHTAELHLLSPQRSRTWPVVQVRAQA